MSITVRAAVTMPPKNAPSCSLWFTRNVRAPESTSTAPESTPIRKVFCFGIPSARRGMETIAPSGKFWIAIPRASASAPAAVIPVSPARKPA